MVSKISIPPLTQSIDRLKKEVYIHRRNAEMWQRIANMWRRSTQIATVCLYILVTLQAITLVVGLI